MTSQQQEALLLSSIQVASEGWISFDWKAKCSQWESTEKKTKEARESSVAARKKLADTTKKFKRSVKGVEQSGASLTVDTIPAAVKSIETLSKDCRTTIRAYQEEVDNLTRRCKAAENAHSSVTQSLMEIPDPAAVLTAAVEQLNLQKKQISALQKAVDDQGKDMDALKAKTANQAAASASTSGLAKQEKEELIQLRREVAEYEVEFRSLKNQDITIRKLEARIEQIQESGEAELEDKFEKAKQELIETEGRRALEALEREAAMERKVHSLELQLKAEVAGRAATQAHLLEADEGAGEREAAWEAQRKILVDDAESLRLRLHEAARERDELRLKVAATMTHNGGAASSGPRGLSSAPPSGAGMGMTDLLNERKAYEAEVSELSHTANSLREELQLKEDLIKEEKTALQISIKQLQQNEATLSDTVTTLEAKLAAAPSQSLLDSMKRELRILKRLEYNADDFEADGDGDGDDLVLTGSIDNEEQDLESVLVAKLRRVEADLVKERNQKADMEQATEALQQQLSELQAKKDESDHLIATLEADLDRATASQQADDNGPAKSSRTSNAPPVTVQDNGAILQSVLDPTAPPPPPLPANANGTRQSSSSSSAQGASANGSRSSADKTQDDHSVATIIMAQRDRLRVRCDALEAERDSFKRELQTQVQSAESLKADNTKLFEKMRYLQSYNSSNGSSGAVAARARSMPKDRDLDLEALEQRYEASVDPFRQFSRAERQRKVQEMSAMERTVFVVAKTFLGSKEMRTFLFFYILAMHLLVFLTTYHWSHGDATSCAMHQEMLSHLPPEMSNEQIIAHVASKK